MTKKELKAEFAAAAKAMPATTVSTPEEAREWLAARFPGRVVQTDTTHAWLVMVGRSPLNADVRRSIRRRLREI